MATRGCPPCALGSRGARLPERGYPRGALLGQWCRSPEALTRVIQRGARPLLAGVHGAGKPLPSRAGRKGFRLRRKPAAYYRAWLALLLIPSTFTFRTFFFLLCAFSTLQYLGRQGSYLPFRLTLGQLKIYHATNTFRLKKAICGAAKSLEQPGSRPADISSRFCSCEGGTTWRQAQGKISARLSRP